MATGAAADQAAQQGEQQQNNKAEDRGPGSVSGNITKDPEVRYTPAGRAVSNLRIASSERRRNDHTGQWEDTSTVYYDIQCWGNLAENVGNYLQRGDRIVAEGRWCASYYEAKDGEIKERVYLNARDLGPSMIFKGARPERNRES